MKSNGHSISVGWALAGLLLFALSGLVFQLQIHSEQARAEREATFQIALHEWEDVVGRYQGCTLQADLRASQIDQWSSFYDAMVHLYADQPAVVSAFTVLRTNIPVFLPALDVADCEQPGERPEP